MPNLKISAMPGLGTNAAPGDLLTIVDVSAPAASANKHETLNNLLSVITRGITDKALRFQTPGTAPAVSLAAQGAIYFDGSDFQISANGGAYAPLLSLSPQADHAVLIGPTSGGPTAPTWRGLTLSDLPAVATDRLLGRVSPLSGDVEEITPGAGVLTWLQTPTSDNLRLAVATTSTGTGALVFGTSPVITNFLTLVGTLSGGTTLATATRQIVFEGIVAGTISCLEIRNATTGSVPLITVNSPSTNYGLEIASKGNSSLTLRGNTVSVVNNIASAGGTLEARGGTGSGGGGSVRMFERSTNGTNYWAWRAPDNITVSVEQELPDGYGITGQALITDGAGVMAWGNVQTFKNLLINGNIQIAQRGLSATALGPTNASSGYHTADRWRIEIDQLGANGQYTQSVESGAGDYPPDTPFRKSIKMTCTQAVTSPLAADAQLRLEQRIESQNLAQVEIGNATAKPLTLSFWVKSNKTGLFVAELIDPNGTEQVSATFTIAATNTWERHVVTFPANPTGTIIANDNSYGLAVSFWLVAGSNFTSGTLQTAWGNTAADRAAGFGSQITLLNDYFQITGVQTEIGSTASEFELIPLASELVQCQRYFLNWAYHTNGTVTSIAQGNAQGPNQVEAVLIFPVSMRSNPSFFATSGSNIYSFYSNAGNTFINSLTGTQLTPRGALIFNNGVTMASGTVAGRFFIPFTISTGARIDFIAEL